MIREAAQFVMAEQVLVEVLGRVRPVDGKIVLPPMSVGDPPLSIRTAIARHARDEAAVPKILAGADPGGIDEDLLGNDAQAALVRLADAACAAARSVDDADTELRDYLRRATITRSFLAHDVAMHLGSRACPLTEELARGLWEDTYPEASVWRERGVFTEPLGPVPDDVSWRDRFLMSAGRDPHALEL